MVTQRAPENDLVITRLEEARRLVRDLQPIQPGFGMLQWPGSTISSARRGTRGRRQARPSSSASRRRSDHTISRGLGPAPGPPRRGHLPAWHHLAMPPIDELTRIEPVHLDRLDHQGIFTTGLLLRCPRPSTRRQTLADQVKADVTDVLMWRDEALMLNLASFGPDEHQLMIQSDIEGLRDILDLAARRLPRPDPERRPREIGAHTADRPHDRGLVGSGQDARGRVGPSRQPAGLTMGS